MFNIKESPINKMFEGESFSKNFFSSGFQIQYSGHQIFQIHKNMKKYK